MAEYIKNCALDYSIAYNDESKIDEINILNATLDSMHKPMDGLSIDVDNILVDGNRFRHYYDKNNKYIPHGNHNKILHNNERELPFFFFFYCFLCIWKKKVQ